ncbi:Hsp20/alpha crystallin family protein [Desulfosarcina sp. OttesenSCG-928-A07]|nr:Hsp20/alpha crystallin family protein [Desulfosarcina sp. OttesenSCG-928-A07]
MIYRTLFGAPYKRLGTPFDEFDTMRQLGRLLGAATGRTASPDAGVFPAINISEDTDNYYISAELPGVKAADLDLNVTANQLTLAGDRKISEEAEDVRYHRREREAGHFSRAIALPGDIDAGRVTARMTDGVLAVTVPKAEKAKPRQVKIQ